MKIINKLMVSFMATALLATSLAVSVAYMVTRNIVENAIYNHLITTAQLKIRTIELFLELEKETIQQVSESVVFKNFLSADKGSADYREKFDMAMKRLINMEKTQKNTYEMFLLDTGGRIIASSDETKIGLDRSQDPYFLRAKTGDYIKDAYFAGTTEQKSMAFSAPILDSETGKFLGVVVNRTKMDLLDRITADRIGLGKMGESYLVNGERYMITPSLAQKDTFLKLKIDSEITRRAVEYMKKCRDKQHSLVPLIYLNYRGVKVLGVHGHILQMEWTLLVEIDEKEVLEPLNKLKSLFLLILICVLALVWVIGVYVSKLISRPISKLHKGIERIEQGDFGYEVGIDAKDEIGQFSRAFDRMTASLKSTVVSRDYLDNVIRSMADMLVVITPEGKIEITNRVLCEFLNYREEELLGKDVSLLFSEEEEEKEERISLKGTRLERLIREGVSRDYEVNYKTKEGKIIPMLLSGIVVKDEDGKIVSIICIAKDITERKKMIEEIKHLNLVLCAIRDVNQIIVREKDPAKLIRLICDKLIETRGYFSAWIILFDKSGKVKETAETGLGKEFMSMVGRLKRGMRPKGVQEALNNQDIIITKDPSSECSDCSLSGIYGGRSRMTIRLERGGNIYGILLVSLPSEFAKDKQEQDLFKEVAGDISFALHDIALGKEHKEMEGQLRLITENVRDLVAVTTFDMKTNLIYVSPSHEKILGYSAQELIGTSYLDILCPEDKKRLRPLLKKYAVAKVKGLLAGTEEKIFEKIEYRFLRKSGGWCLLEGIVTTSEGKLFFVSRDITERKRAEEALKESELRVRQIAETIGDVFWTIEWDSKKATFVSEAYENIWGRTLQSLYDDPEGWFSSIHPEDRTRTLGKFIGMGKGEDYDEEYRIIKPTGEVRWIRDRGYPIRTEQGEMIQVVGVAQDITDTRKMQKTLIATEKLASLGKLVSDMAHEVNNPLMIVVGRAQLSMMEGTKDKEVKENLRIIMDQCMRAKNIIQRLLAFSRPNKGLVSEIDINGTVNLVIKLMEHQFTLINITIVKKYEKGLPLIRADEHQVHEVVMNLLKNASEAMLEGGIITVTTKRDKDHIRIDVSDTGEGISEANMQKVFDPFFTTKKTGTGLGLSVCYGLIKDHGGELKFSSELGKGTTATILLPISKEGYRVSDIGDRK